MGALVRESWDLRRGSHNGGTCHGGELEVKLFKIIQKSIEMKPRDDSMAAFGIHSYRHSFGFDQIEWANRWGSIELTQTIMPLPRRWTENP